jgi:hypothetical protein
MQLVAAPHLVRVDDAIDLERDVDPTLEIASVVNDRS